MALKKSGNDSNLLSEYESLSETKAKEVFASSRLDKEKKILTTFSIEPSFKAELEELFADLGLGWAAGVRFALKEFSKKYKNWLIIIK